MEFHLRSNCAQGGFTGSKCLLLSYTSRSHSNFQGSAKLAKRIGKLPILGSFYFEGFEVGLGLVSEGVINIVWSPCEVSYLLTVSFS